MGRGAGWVDAMFTVLDYMTITACAVKTFRPVARKQGEIKQKKQHIQAVSDQLSFAQKRN